MAALGCIVYVILLQMGQLQNFSTRKTVLNGVDDTADTYNYSSQPHDSGNNFNYTSFLSNTSVNASESEVHPIHNFSSKPILTLFTTFRNSESKRCIHENTIRIWRQLSPDVILILFTEGNSSDPKGIPNFAVQHGWHVFPVPKTSPMGIPVLRHMFLEAQKNFNTTFYCYANGDILFDRNLTDTIRLLQTSARGGHINKLLVVGRRSNWYVGEGVPLMNLTQVGHFAKNSSLFQADAQDYFLTTRDGYPWATIPNFVVGRVAYDNWLVVTALTKKIPVVDATETVTALHQTGTDGNHAGIAAEFENDINVNLAKTFDFSIGQVTCANFFTHREGGKIVIMERKSRGESCNTRKAPFVIKRIESQNRHTFQTTSSLVICILVLLKLLLLLWVLRATLPIVECSAQFIQYIYKKVL